MKTHILSVDGKKGKQIDLPKFFSAIIREDIVAKVLEAKKIKQPYGPSALAGNQYSASGKINHRRHVWKTHYGKGISRVPRKILTRRGRQMFWVGAVAPGTVGGRRAHPPKPYKNLTKKINKKENRKAIRSALAATMEKSLVEARGHSVPKEFPFIVNDSITSLSKTKAAAQALGKLGFDAELKRTAKKTIRAGKGKLRGRKYSRKTGPLIVVAQKCSLQKSADSIPGVEVVLVDELNPEMLAPGSVPGRLTLFTSSALDKMKKENLYK